MHIATVTPPWWRSTLAEAQRRAAAWGSTRCVVSWSPGLRCTAHLRLPSRRLRTFDRVVATSWRTAELCSQALADPPTTMSYFVQSYETWSGPRERVDATWRLPVTKMVIAQWLMDKAAELDASPVVLVPNAIDTDHWRVLAPPETREPTRVAMLWHADPVKGSDIGLAALTLAREQLPALSADVISTYAQPRGIPAWVRWHHRLAPSQLVTLFNEAALFLSPSRMEGWALPPAEAMACGCALVATDIGGVRDYAVDGVTALLAPVDDPAALAARVMALATDAARRVSLAGAGRDLLRTQFSWETSSRKLEETLVRGE